MIIILETLLLLLYSSIRQEWKPNLDTSVIFVDFMKINFFKIIFHLMIIIKGKYLLLNTNYYIYVKLYFH